MKLIFLYLSILSTELLLHNKAFSQKSADSEGVRIAWDYNSLQKFAEREGYLWKLIFRKPS